MEQVCLFGQNPTMQVQAHARASEKKKGKEEERLFSRLTQPSGSAPACFSIMKCVCGVCMCVWKLNSKKQLADACHCPVSWFHFLCWLYTLTPVERCELPFITGSKSFSLQDNVYKTEVNCG